MSDPDPMPMESDPPLILATRGSALALAQTRMVQRTLLSRFPSLDVRESVIRTTGDNRLDLSLITSPGVAVERGLFTRELELALLSGEAHAAVHSLKDLPTQLPDGLGICGMLPREDPTDVAVIRDYSSLDLLPAGAIVGTSSVRRRMQLASRFPDLHLREIRGNVPTRLEKLAREEFHAIILAGAGLRRLGFPSEGILDCSGHPLHLESLHWMLPAVGQGAVAIEANINDSLTHERIASISCTTTRIETEAERELLRALGGGCQMPLGVRTQLHEGTLTMEAILFRDGIPKTASLTGDPNLPHRLAAILLA